MDRFSPADPTTIDSAIDRQAADGKGIMGAVPGAKPRPAIPADAAFLPADPGDVVAIARLRLCR